MIRIVISRYQRRAKRWPGPFRRPSRVKSGRKKPRPTAAEQRVAALLRSDDPKVVTLVRVCGNWFGLRRDGDQVRVQKLGRR